MDKNTIIEMPAYKLSQVIHKKEASCVEVMNAYLDHIDKVNPRVHAIITLQERDNLISQAREKDNLLYQGKDCGWMHGFPQALKDMVATKGIRTTKGSPILKDWIPDADAVLAERMKAAGSIIIGKTNLPEWGYGSNSYNSLFDTVGNPYDAGKTAGGSSGGAACSVAMRMQPVADGGDSMGSLRNPAGWCNVYGFRPSFGSVPKPSVELFASCMSTDGSIGRNVADVALLYSTISGYHPGDPHSRDIDPRIQALTTENVHDKLQTDVSGKKVAWLGDWGGHIPFEKGIMETCEDTLKTFPSFGVAVEPIKPFYDPEDLWENVWLPIRHYSICSLRGHYNDPEKRKLIKPEVIYECESGIDMSVQTLFDAFAKRSAYYVAMMSVFDKYDYIAVPTAQVWPFDKEIHWPKEIEGRKMKTYHNWMEVSIAATLGCNAAMSIPAGFSKEGLPTGMQLIAKPRTDFELLQFCKAYEAVNDFVGKYRPAELTK